MRPATCETRWYVRSAARKSGWCSIVSASITPTSVTFGKSSPLAIICVPSSRSVSPAAKADRAASCAPGRRMESLSMRVTRRSGNLWATSFSSRCVPVPNRLRTDSLQLGHRSGAAVSKSQVWQTARPRSACHVSVTEQCGHSIPFWHFTHHRTVL